jgi:eukaryotic-like serine/threonine-protein kinase
MERALVIRENALGRTHPHVADSLTALAELHYSMGEHDEAKRSFERALAIDEAALGSDHPRVTHSLLGLAKVALAQDRPADAVLLAERALTIREKGNIPAHELASSRFVFAQALWEASVMGDRVRARAIAEQARDAYQAAGEGSSNALVEVERWLAEHRIDG